MIQLHKLAIHEIIKEIKSTTVGHYYSSTVISLSKNPGAKKLIEKINNAYEEDEIVYSAFSMEKRLTNFPGEFKGYNNGKKTEKVFLDFSRDTLENLRQQLTKVPAAKGGYYVYAEYHYDGEDFIGIFLIRDTEGILFNKTEDGKGFSVDTIDYMNTEKLAMACRISLTKFNGKKDHYLTLIKRNQETISDYFYDWISTANKESSSEYTEALYDIISQLPLPTNKLTNEKYTIDQLRKDVELFIHQQNRDVDIRYLSKEFYGDPRLIVKFAKDNNITIDSTFKADKKTLRKFKQVNVNADGIRVQFSQGDITNQKIRFSPENDNMVIIESAKFADALRRQLSEYQLNAGN